MKLVICDLDNTLYDWIGFYAQSFRAMLHSLSELSLIPVVDLITDFKAVHQKYGTSEYAFSIQELASLKTKHRGLNESEIVDIYWPVIETFREVRHNTLKPYPGVKETLEKIQQAGITIVGHTDSMAYYAAKRLSNLELGAYFNRLYVAEEHPLPDYVQANVLERQSWPFGVVALPLSHKKPNVQILMKIMADFDVEVTETVFVGDSLNRDMTMATQAGVHAVWARYGNDFSQSDFELLVSITHWSDKDVQKENISFEDVKPTTIIDSFTELLSILSIQ